MSMMIKDSMGKLLTTLSVPNTMSIKDFKYELEDRLLIPPHKMRLFYKGVKLSDGPTLEDYDLSDGSTLHLKNDVYLTPRRNSRRRQELLNSGVVTKIQRYFGSHTEQVLRYSAISAHTRSRY